MYRQSEKNLLSSNISPTWPHNMVNFGSVAAEIVSLVWGTPGNFNGFRVLACSVTARHSSSGRQPNCGIEQRAPPIFGRAPSRWALAHISSWTGFCAVVYSEWSNVTEICGHVTISMLWDNTSYTVLSWVVKICLVIHIKLNQLV